LLLTNMKATQFLSIAGGYDTTTTKNIRVYH
jgi:hypothetical protein